MRAFVAFVGKEWLELTRSGKFFVLLAVFVLFGVMNPAIAKLTPWMMEVFSESFEEIGIVMGEVEVNALTSWTQFYKNVPIALILFLIMFSGILTTECQKGTLIPILTKGMQRWKVMLAKISVTILLWTGGYWTCYGITYGYNQYFWDNGIVFSVWFAAFCLYLVGVWLNSLLLLSSAVLRTNTAVLAATGGVFLLVYLAGMIPGAAKYLPAQLFHSASLLSGSGEAKEYGCAIGITALSCVVNLVFSVIGFNKKAL